MTEGAWLRFYDNLPYFVNALFAGVVMTVIVTLGALVVSLLLGLMLACLKATGSRTFAVLIYVYVEVFRAIPVLTQLFIIYFGLATIGIKLDPIPAAIIGFGLNGGAYLAEVFRAGIEGVDRGQTEAAKAIGMPPAMILFSIVLPQAIRIILPSLANFSIGLLKETSLASAVAAPELSFQAHMLIDRTFLSTQIYCLVALVYLALSLPLSYLSRALERRFGRGVRI
ncbi:amino acid ABC transporter permease (plasmid) [Agrobacterium vitis]|uniref:amino acid ABC transporter permease n=1 Tax=Agrobacterium vitis TaxID=373 RepID=UPI0015D6D9D5|nr:amino acid ABC transporter permease [Agrobacterium vitis]BCH62019.1 amino acid ABC transporter permease [Agrobacterium vitis]